MNELLSGQFLFEISLSALILSIRIFAFIKVSNSDFKLIVIKSQKFSNFKNNGINEINFLYPSSEKKVWLHCEGFIHFDVTSEIVILHPSSTQFKVELCSPIR